MHETHTFYASCWLKTFFVGLYRRIPDNFTFSALLKIYLAGSPMSVRNSGYSDMVNPKSLENISYSTHCSLL